MPKINWSKYLVWRESKDLNNADVMIYVGNPNAVIEVKTAPILVNGDSVVQVQLGGKANILVPLEMIGEE